MITAERQALIEQMEATWGDLTVIFNVTDAERTAWREMVERFQKDLPGNSIEPPWGVLKLTAFEPADWGVANEAYEGWAHFYFMAGTEDDDGAPRNTRDLLSYLEALAGDMTAALRAMSSITVLDTRIDLSDDSEPNKFFIAFNQPFHALQVSARIVVGRTP